MVFNQQTVGIRVIKDGWLVIMMGYTVILACKWSVNSMANYPLCFWVKYVCHGQKLDSLEAQASTKRGGRGGVAPHQLSHGVDIWTILSNDEVPQSVTCCVPMPLLYRVTCILADLQVVSMSTSCVVLACRVDLHHCLVRDHFRSLRLTRGRCPHSVTDRYLLEGHHGPAVVCCWRLQTRGLSSGICLCQAVGCVLWWRRCHADPRMPHMTWRWLAPGYWTFQRWFFRLEPCLKILARIGVSHLHLTMNSC